MIKWATVAGELSLLFPGRVHQDVDLRTMSRWRIGGNATLVVQPASIADVVKIIQYTNAHDLPRVVIGDGSNLLFDDDGLEALVIRLGRHLAAFSVTGQRVFSEAGVWVPHLVRRLGNMGLSGLQHAIGIPGTLGGLICMNGGSQRRGIGDNILEVTCVSSKGVVETFNREQCEFRYRHSIFMQNRGIVVSCAIELEKKAPSLLRREMLEILRSRRKKFPLKLPNCGSVFLSSPEMYDSVGPPGRSIEEAGLKGVSIGGAQVSELHANFIVNTGDATSNDVLRLIQKARQQVFDMTGYWLECEVRYVSPIGVITPAHLALSTAFH